MATDADGVTFSVSSNVWYDDGHSPDWIQGVVQGFPSYPTNSATINPSGGGSSMVRIFPLIHVHKPPNPPDR